MATEKADWRHFIGLRGKPDTRYHSVRFGGGHKTGHRPSDPARRRVTRINCLRPARRMSKGPRDRRIVQGVFPRGPRSQAFASARLQQGSK
jgi:hypothetical protein